MKFRLEAVLALSNTERTKFFESNQSAKKYFTKDLVNPKINPTSFSTGKNFNRHKDNSK